MRHAMSQHNILHFLMLCLLALASTLSTSAKGKPKEPEVRFFARFECQRDYLTVEDSVVVNIVLYSNVPFQSATTKTKDLKIRGGHSRKLPKRGDMQQQRVRMEDGIYYGIIYDRYIVGSDAVGEIRLPEIKFEAEVMIYDGEDYPEQFPFDPFGFFSRPQPRFHIVRAKCTSPAFVLPVKARPKRSTQEILSSGGRVA